MKRLALATTSTSRITQKIAVVFALSVVSLTSGRIYGESPDHVLKVWPGQPPGEKMNVGPEQDFTKDTDNLIAGRRIIKLGNVSTPEAHVYLPPANLRTGASVVVCPGGGFSILAWDLEGTEVAQWLNTLGVAAIVLKYRVPTRDQNPRWLAPAQDTQRTISHVRQHAEEWGLDVDKVGVLGFSAGGMTAAKVTLADKRYYKAIDETDKSPCNPDRAILIYAALPSEPSLESVVNSKTPPTFMIHAFDDFVPVEGTAKMLLAMKKAEVPCELHVYDAGGHGYGLRKRDDLPVTHWTSDCEAWLRRAKWID